MPLESRRANSVLRLLLVSGPLAVSWARCQVRLRPSSVGFRLACWIVRDIQVVLQLRVRQWFRKLEREMLRSVLEEVKVTLSDCVWASAVTDCTKYPVSLTKSPSSFRTGQGSGRSASTSISRCRSASASPPVNQSESGRAL